MVIKPELISLFLTPFCSIEDMVPLSVTVENSGNILLLCFQVFLATVIMACNLLTFVSIITSESFKKENRFIYMMGTCASDFCSGAFWYYLGVFDVRDNIPRKNDTRFVGSTFVGISYLTILAAQTDRYFAVSFPMWYLHRMTLKKTVVIMVLIWVYSFVILISQNLTPSSTALRIQAMGFLVWTCITYIIMIGLNIKLFCIAKYQLERLETADREYKRTSLYMIIAVAATFLVFWTPVFLRSLICVLSPMSWCIPENTGTDPIALLPRFSCVVSPLLYIKGCSSIRKNIQAKLCRCCSRMCV